MLTIRVRHDGTSTIRRALRRDIHAAWNKVKARRARSAWGKRNKNHVNANVKLYSRRVRRATPKWADRDAMRRIYKEAGARGLEVDHIVPLHGVNVSGLHVPWNLQLLTREENAAKSNRHEEYV